MNRPEAQPTNSELMLVAEELALDVFMAFASEGEVEKIDWYQGKPLGALALTFIDNCPLPGIVKDEVRLQPGGSEQELKMILEDNITLGEQHAYFKNRTGQLRKRIEAAHCAGNATIGDSFAISDLSTGSISVMRHWVAEPAANQKSFQRDSSIYFPRTSKANHRSTITTLLSAASLLRDTHGMIKEIPQDVITYVQPYPQNLTPIVVVSPHNPDLPINGLEPTEWLDTYAQSLIKKTERTSALLLTDHTSWSKYGELRGFEGISQSMRDFIMDNIGANHAADLARLEYTQKILADRT